MINRCSGHFLPSPMDQKDLGNNNAIHALENQFSKAHDEIRIAQALLLSIGLQYVVPAFHFGFPFPKFSELRPFGSPPVKTRLLKVCPALGSSGWMAPLALSLSFIYPSILASILLRPRIFVHKLDLIQTHFKKINAIISEKFLIKAFSIFRRRVGGLEVLSYTIVYPLKKPLERGPQIALIDSDMSHIQS